MLAFRSKKKEKDGHGLKAGKVLVVVEDEQNEDGGAQVSVEESAVARREGEDAMQVDDALVRSLYE